MLVDVKKERKEKRNGDIRRRFGKERKELRNKEKKGRKNEKKMPRNEWLTHHRKLKFLSLDLKTVFLPS